ncbi:MAG: hypothetical protein K6F35_10825 [Lachnospiraceae bacterium]|nr:hypothetical protein [Lachnospiraceae bacterium]
MKRSMENQPGQNVPREKAGRKEPGLEIAYQNKDIVSKILADSFRDDFMEAYGIRLPRILRTGPTNLPAVMANELRIDVLFELEDGSVAIVDCESRHSVRNKLKYMNYISRVSDRMLAERGQFTRIHMVVIYTADVRRGTTDPVLDLGAMRMELTEGFLSDFSPDELYRYLEGEVGRGGMLSDDALMKLVIYPLSYPGTGRKKEAVPRAVGLAREIADDRQRAFALAGICAFADKIITEEDANNIRRELSMTKVGRLFAEEMENAENRLKTAEKKLETAEKEKETAVKEKETAEKERAELERKLEAMTKEKEAAERRAEMAEKRHWFFGRKPLILKSWQKLQKK